MLQVVARLPDGKAFCQTATSVQDALTIVRATEALTGDRNNIWIERDGQRLDPDDLRRSLGLQNLPPVEPSGKAHG